MQRFALIVGSWGLFAERTRNPQHLPTFLKALSRSGVVLPGRGE